MRIVLRDPNGKETVTEYAYYNSTNLLAPGVFDYSAEAGFARQFYGLYSDVYDGNPISSASFRYGVTPRITVEGHAEGGAGLANLGAGVNFGLWNYGVASFALSGSDWSGAFGGQVYGSFETTVWGARFMARALQSLGDFEDLGFRHRPEMRPSCCGMLGWKRVDDQTEDQSRFRFRLWFDASTISLSYTDSLEYDDFATKVGTVSYSRPFFWENSTVSLNVFNDFEQKNSYGAYAALTYTWGKYSAGAIAEASGNTYAAGGSLTRSLDDEVGSYGYSITGAGGAAV